MEENATVRNKKADMRRIAISVALRAYRPVLSEGKSLEAALGCTKDQLSVGATEPDFLNLVLAI